MASMERRVKTITEESVGLPAPFPVNPHSVHYETLKNEPEAPHIITAIDPEFPLSWPSKCDLKMARMFFTLSSRSIWFHRKSNTITDDNGVEVLS